MDALPENLCGNLYRFQHRPLSPLTFLIMKCGMNPVSSPTGPAFEGAQITYGQRAASGAIERVRIDPETLESRIQVIGSELWSDDPGFKDSIAEFAVSGICGSGIIEAVAQMYLAGVLSSDAVIIGKYADKSDRVVADDRTWSSLLYNRC